jgi:hypothetical protein
MTMVTSTMMSGMRLPLMPPLGPMLAKSVTSEKALKDTHGGKDVQWEPKWDGSGGMVMLRRMSGRGRHRNPGSGREIAHSDDEARCVLRVGRVDAPTTRIW